MENWDSLVWILVKISILSLVIERALYVVFEWSVWKIFEDFIYDRGDWLDMKPPISIAVGVFLALLVRVDLVSLLFESTDATTVGMIVTGLYIAGGSKAVFVMFKRLRELRDAKAEAQIRG